MADTHTDKPSAPPFYAPMGTVYLLKFPGGDTEREFVSAESYRDMVQQRDYYAAKVNGTPRSAVVASADPYQLRVDQFMLRCFGFDIAEDTVERNHRFLEESLELVQALGCTAADAHMLVDYVYGRPTGEPHQEAGGVMVTLAALCTAAGLDMTRAGEDELARVFGKIDIIREKQKAKPKGSPLPEYAERHRKRMMERFDTQFIETEPSLGRALPDHLNEYQAQNPKARLVTVMLSPRNPGGPQVYRAVWAERLGGDKHE